MVFIVREVNLDAELPPPPPPPQEAKIKPPIGNKANLGSCFNNIGFYYCES